MEDSTRDFDGLVAAEEAKLSERMRRMDVINERVVVETAEMVDTLRRMESLAGEIRLGDPAWPLAEVALRVGLMIRRQAFSLSEAADVFDGEMAP